MVRSSMKVALERLLSIEACLLASAAASLACKRQRGSEFEAVVQQVT